MAKIHLATCGGAAQKPHKLVTGTRVRAASRIPPPPGAAEWLLSRSKGDQQLARIHLHAQRVLLQALGPQRGAAAEPPPAETNPTHHFERGRQARDDRGPGLHQEVAEVTRGAEHRRAGAAGDRGLEGVHRVGADEEHGGLVVGGLRTASIATFATTRQEGPALRGWRGRGWGHEGAAGAPAGPFLHCTSPLVLNVQVQTRAAPLTCCACPALGDA